MVFNPYSLVCCWEQSSTEAPVVAAESEITVGKAKTALEEAAPQIEDLDASVSTHASTNSLPSSPTQANDEPCISVYCAPVVGVHNFVVWQWMWGNHKFEDHTSLGLELGCRRHVIVKRVREGGLAHRWNEANKDIPGKHMIVKGAVIVGVNDVVDHGHGNSVGLIRKALRSSSELDITMRYVPYFELNSAAKELGVTANDLEGGVKEITFVSYVGAIPEHNKDCKPGFEVMAGDRILEVRENLHSDIRTICIKRTAFEGGTFTS